MMKRKITALLCTGAMTLGLLATGVAAADSSVESAAGSTAESMVESVAGGEKADGIQASPEFYETADLSVLEGKNIGITIQSLENAYWAGVMTALQEKLDETGASTTIVACDDSSATQIGQVENFISSGCDLIMIHPSDAAAVEDVAKEARDAGIKVMCWDDPMENTDGNWILDNTDLGFAIGQLTAEFINEYYDEDNKAQVTVIGYPQTVILKEREEGILAGMAAGAEGKYDVIANQAAIDANTAQTAMETILIAHPECKVVAGIGAGAMIGADEALNIQTGGDIPEDMGVFTTDVTKQQLEQLSNPSYPAKGIIGFEGSDEDTANACASMFALILSDSLESQNVYRNVAPITADNVEEISAGMK